MMGLAHIMKDARPDLILSGVNRGANLGEDVTYSGTVSAAMEGALAGIPSIALSQSYAKEGMGDTVPFAAAEAWARARPRPAARRPVRAAHPGQRQLPRAAAGRGQGHPRRPPGPARLRPAAGSSSAPTRAATIITGSASRPMIQTPGHETDLEAISDGYVTVTPLHLDLTHEESLARLADPLR